MKRQIILPAILLISTLFPSCFKEIDTVPMSPSVEESFTVQNSIREVQSFYRFYKTAVEEVATASKNSWDLAFESDGEGSRVLLGWATNSTTAPSGKFDFAEITQDLILDKINDTALVWGFDDPTFVTIMDSLVLTNHWEDGEVYIQNRGLSKDTYYVIQYVSSTADSYTFRYASAQQLDQVHEATVNRAPGMNYVYYSYETHRTVTVEPLSTTWDLLCTPYRGWWETDDPGVYSPFNMSGIMINNENGVRIVRIFDPEISFGEIDSTYIDLYANEFTDLKGAIGANWKLLGAVGSTDLYTMDPDKKYLMKKYDDMTGQEMYFKLQIIDYKLDGQDHYPTIEFKYLGTE
ncbi:MAG: hypothetical protein ABFS10_09715 [Bacteroidota bacterium]